MKKVGDSANKSAASADNFVFDQIGRHISFWDFVRAKNWEAVTTYFDKKAVLYHNKIIRKRQWRVVDYIENIFEDTPSLLLQNPFIFKPGVTRSSVMVEVTQDRHNFRGMPAIILKI